MRKGSPGALSPAHRGYAYQDLVAACLLVEALIESCEEVVIDRKVVNDDRFDDIGLRSRAGTVRRQLKSSAHSGRRLCAADFEDARSSLRMDRLIATYVEAGPAAAIEYRLCATWLEPEVGDPLRALLQPATVDGTFRAHATLLFRLNPDLAWPPGGTPRLASLAVSAGVLREQFVAFCAKFVIELGFPPAALDLEAPGLLESLLLQRLHEDVGIGRYPNEGRRLEDVAALAIYMASTARIDSSSFTPADIAHGLALRTDFGRVAQAFPLDRAVLQERPNVAKHLAVAAAAGGVHLVLAGPGAGKSWQLSQLADAQRAAGAIVARHYCFLEPGDELVERRVTSNALFGNLVAELHDELERRTIDPGTRFASGPEELETSFKAAEYANTRVVVIVDGLDHIARVRANQSSLSDTDTDIVERLATLRLPPNVSLIIGSQPGPHLDPLRLAFADRLSTYELPPWAATEMVQFQRRLGVQRAMEAAAIDAARIERFEELLAIACEGNPLYGRYLAEELVTGLEHGSIDVPEAWLAYHPPLHGDIANYYAYLYSKVGAPAQPIAAILGLLEFSVTQADLEDMLPLLAGWMPETLQVLAPLLLRIAGQGGVRIFHESFRRFIIDELRRAGKPAGPLLDAVVAWLAGRGFMPDARSYRFLLPTLRRAERHSEILGLVGGEFAARSLAHGYSEAAIRRNLDIAANVAAHQGDWPAVMRLAELSRAITSCFQPGSGDWGEFWRTYAALFGPESLAERLLFEGRPTLSKDEGLACCELIDQSGATAPWREYMELPDATEDRSIGSSHFDEYAGIDAQDAITLARLRGRIRLGGGFRVLRRICENLYAETAMKFAFVRGLGRTVYQEYPAGLSRKLASRGQVSAKVAPRHRINARECCALWLGFSDAAADAGDFIGMGFYATRALGFAQDAQQAAWCVERGAPPSHALPMARALAGIDLSLGAHSISNASAVREWVSSAMILALNGRRETFDAERARIAGEGWYRCWLRYVLALAEAQSEVNLSCDTHDLFEELLTDLRPFAGQPRACDLYSIHEVIRKTLGSGLTLPQTRDAWKHACECIVTANRETATRLDREDGGPISSGALIALLEPHVRNPLAADVALSTIETEVSYQQGAGTYYATHAEFSMRLARVLGNRGHDDRAQAMWLQACNYLLGYGFHKDIALFDLIECIPALRAHEAGRFALGALARLQPLVCAVQRHTDLRETRHAPNAWFSALLEVDRPRALEHVARMLRTDPGGESWIAVRALADCLRTSANDADPLLTNALWETLFFECRYESDAQRMVDDRLAALRQLAAAHPELAESRFRRLCAEVQDDSRHHGIEAWPKLQQYAAAAGSRLGPPNRATAPESRTTSYPAAPTDTGVFTARAVTIVATSRFVDLLAAIRKLAEERLSEDDLLRLVVLPLSYLITGLVEQEEEFQARRLLSFLAHEARGWYFEPVHPVTHLAVALDNAGHRELACIAYTLSYSVSRGGGGWLAFGGHKRAADMRRAIELDRRLALRTLAEEAARKIQNGTAPGVTRHLIQELAAAGELEQAAAAWDQAFLVMERRLPHPGRSNWFPQLDPGDPCDWTLDEALALVLLVRSGNPLLNRRSLALLGLAHFLDRGELRVLARPLADWLTRDSTVSSQHAVLGLLDRGTDSLDELVRSLEGVFATAAGARSWCIASLASRQLARAGASPVARARAENSAPSAPSRSALRRLLTGDRAKILQGLEEIWPGLSTLLAARLEPFDLSRGAQHDYHRERTELEYGRTRRFEPNAPVISWPAERVLAVLDEELIGIEEAAWKHGTWSDELEDEVLTIVVPDVWLHASVQSTRIARPTWADLRTPARELRQPVRVENSHPEYGGWIRLAAFEREYLVASGRSYADPDSLALRFSGLVRTEIDGTVPRQLRPFVDGAPHWWTGSSADARTDASSFALTGMCIETDMLGREYVIAPIPPLTQALGLQPGNFLDGFLLLDATARPAVVGRTWRQTEQGGQGADEAVSTSGMDILLRPDLLNRCQELFRSPIKDLVEVLVDRLKD